MKKVFFTLIFLFTLIVNAQEESYTSLSETEQEKALKISKEKTGSSITFDKGMNYNQMLFWHITTTNGKDYYFNSSNSFTNINYEEASYSSLMEYVIETIGF